MAVIHRLVVHPLQLLRLTFAFVSQKSKTTDEPPSCRNQERALAPSGTTFGCSRLNSEIRLNDNFKVNIHENNLFIKSGLISFHLLFPSLFMADAQLKQTALNLLAADNFFLRASVARLRKLFRARTNVSVHWHASTS